MDIDRKGRKRKTLEEGEEGKERKDSNRNFSTPKLYLRYETFGRRRRRRRKVVSGSFPFPKRFVVR